jgi:antitoxin (DNA-binding transcriptional repressor) of toxin-antitoxin stability system
LTVKTITIRDLRTHPRQAREALRQGEETLLTANGKPVALMVPVSGETLDDTLRALRRARAQLALVAVRAGARETGRDRLPVRAIDEAVAAVRRQRGRERRATGR